jgi:hypothetical protein
MIALQDLLRYVRARHLGAGDGESVDAHRRAEASGRLTQGTLIAKPGDV